MEKAVDLLMDVLDDFLDEYDRFLDEGKPIDIADHTRRINRAMNIVNCTRAGIPLPNKPGPKPKTPCR